MYFFSVQGTDHHQRHECLKLLLENLLGTKVSEVLRAWKLSMHPEQDSQEPAFFHPPALHYILHESSIPPGTGRRFPAMPGEW